MANTLGAWETRSGEPSPGEYHTKNHKECPGCSMVRLRQFFRDVEQLVARHVPRCSAHRCILPAMWRLTYDSDAGTKRDELLCDAHNHGESVALPSAVALRRVLQLL
jgi:hypothetical protein